MHKNAGINKIEALVVFALVAILVALVPSAGRGAREKGRSVSCMNNLNVIGKGFVHYLNDTDDVMFSVSKTGDDAWPNSIQRKYVQGWNAFRSPFDRPTESRPRTTAESSGVVPVSYGINGALFDTNKGDWRSELSKLIFAAPAIEKTPSALGWQPDAFSNQNCKVTPGGTGNFGTSLGRSDLNVLFADAHTESMSCSKFADDASESGKVRWYPK
jgi:hypothetical protein